MLLYENSNLGFFKIINIFLTRNRSNKYSLMTSVIIYIYTFFLCITCPKIYNLGLMWILIMYNIYFYSQKLKILEFGVSKPSSFLFCFVQDIFLFYLLLLLFAKLYIRNRKKGKKKLSNHAQKKSSIRWKSYMLWTIVINEEIFMRCLIKNRWIMISTYELPIVEKKTKNSHTVGDFIFFTILYGFMIPTQRFINLFLL